MPYSLVPMVANAAPGPFGVIGTHPLSLDFGGHALILDATIAYAWTPDLIPDPRATWICDQKDDIVTGAARAALQALVPGRVMGARFSDIVGDMLKTPPPGKWKPLTPHQGRRQLEILLGPGEFLGPGVHNPGLLWSEPAAVGGPHSKTLVDTFNRANGAFSGSTSSDGQFTWSLVTGTSARNNIVSNQMVTSRSGVNEDASCLASLGLDTADAYAWTDVTMTGTVNYVGPYLRSTNGHIADPSETGYILQMDIGFGGTITLYNARIPVSPFYSTIASVSAGGATSGSLYVQFVGSSYYVQRNGVTLFSGTDTAWDGSAGHRKVGFDSGVYTLDTNSVSIDNFFAGDIVTAQPALQREQQAMIIREAWLGAY